METEGQMVPQADFRERSILNSLDVEDRKETGSTASLKHFGDEPAAILGCDWIERPIRVRDEHGLAHVVTWPEMK